MAFTVTDLMDLKRLLVEHPEWRTELRQLVLTEELLTLPELVRELAEAQARTEQRLEELAQAQARTEQRLEELAQAQARTEQRLEELAQAQARTEQRLEELAQAQARTEQRLEELAQVQARTEARLEKLEAVVQKLAEAQTSMEKAIHTLADRQGAMLGTLLELRYGRHAAGYFGRILRRVRVVLPHALDAATEDTLEARLTHEELVDVLLLDLLLVGRLRQPSDPERSEVWLAIEVAAVLDQDDVERAQRRAALLRKAGYRAIPVVAGQGVTPEATSALQETPVVLVLDGRSEGWDAALATAA